MYHEEIIIDGVLCYRGTPDGEWTEYDRISLTGMNNGLKAENERLRAALKRIGSGHTFYQLDQSIPEAVRLNGELSATWRFARKALEEGE